MGVCKNCQISKMGNTSFKSKNYHFERKEASPPKSPKSPKATKLQTVQLESQSEGPESQSKGPELTRETKLK